MLKPEIRKADDYPTTNSSQTFKEQLSNSIYFIAVFDARFASVPTTTDVASVTETVERICPLRQIEFREP
jgi:hypothetical protein